MNLLFENLNWYSYMNDIKLLWADDEIESLKPQILFLEAKGYEVVTVTNGHDALDEIKNTEFDVIFLDESMPGLTGLETLEKIKEVKPLLPIVMITKNEAEDVMEEAIGSQISDYLIKPVNPNQILLSLKRLLDNKRLVREKTTTSYQESLRSVVTDMHMASTHTDWASIYGRLLKWELKLDKSDSHEMKDVLLMQKSEANKEFSRFISNNYEYWINKPEDAPIQSHNLLRNKLFPKVNKDKPTVLLLLDNLRMDQWKILRPYFAELFKIQSEEHFYSILPTTTQYSRNSIFAGMMPLDIYKNYPDWWVFDHEDGGKNNYEEKLLEKQLDRVMRSPVKMHYQKITNTRNGKILEDRAMNVMNYDLSVIVYNFIDTLSHARTEMEVLKELASDEQAYRSLTVSWFLHSPLYKALKKIAEKDVRLFLTTDHGTIRVNKPIKVIGDRDTTSNLRYKLGRNLKYDKKDVLAFKEPSDIGLPKPNFTSSFIFSRQNDFFLYPNNYNYHKNFYADTFQHGGISMEEIICPVVWMESK